MKNSNLVEKNAEIKEESTNTSRELETCLSNYERETSNIMFEYTLELALSIQDYNER